MCKENFHFQFNFSFFIHYKEYEEQYSCTRPLQLLISVSLSGPADSFIIQPCEKLRPGWSLFPIRSKAKYFSNPPSRLQKRDVTRSLYKCKFRRKDSNNSQPYFHCCSPSINTNHNASFRSPCKGKHHISPHSILLILLYLQTLQLTFVELVLIGQSL